MATHLKTIYNKLKNTISRGGYFPLLFLALLTQVTLYQWAVFHNLLLSSLWKHPFEFFTFWWPKVGACLFVASFALLSRRKWWTVALPSVVGLWATANYVYFRANGIMLSFEAMLMGDNLAGFWQSALSYFNPTAIAFPLIAVGYALLLIPLKSTGRHPRAFAAAMLAVALLHVPSAYPTNRLFDHTNERRLQWIDINPWAQTVIHQRNYHYGYYASNISITHWILWQTKQYSLLHTIPDVVVEHVAARYYTRHLAEMLREDADNCPALPTEVQHRLVQPAGADTVPQANLVLLLVESLESWVITADDEQGTPIAPHLRRLAAQGLYCPRVCSQVLHGVSGDGQMIANTDLLPIADGAACRLYAGNTWPGWAALFAQSATIIPTHRECWNQEAVTPAYGYRALYDHPGEWQDDLDLVQRTARYADTVGTRPFALQALTVGTHTPFKQKHPSAMALGSLPQQLGDYLRCMHYADSCIGVLLDGLDTTGTILAITGDHTIFKDLDPFRAPAAALGYDLATGHNFVPLIMVGNGMAQRTVADTCYQMDIYPTLLHAIGCRDHWWKGFGMDLLDSLGTRPFAEADAYRYSDIIIKTDWLGTLSR